MKGLTSFTEKVFEALSHLPFIREYTLIGGSALALQIHHRLSEDLDFCIWTRNVKKDKPEVNWLEIEKELGTIGRITSRDILGFDQVNFLLDGVKLTFLTKQENLSPVRQPFHISNFIFAADLEAIGAMKIELILRRSEFRDYYDIYSILKTGIPLKNLVTQASRYSNFLLKTRDALSFLSKGNNYQKEKNFDLLKPIYSVDSAEIEAFIRALILKEYGNQ
jgi:predicted nucleotidyltransferase component of viral defense system